MSVIGHNKKEYETRENHRWKGVSYIRRRLQCHPFAFGQETPQIGTLGCPSLWITKKILGHCLRTIQGRGGGECAISGIQQSFVTNFVVFSDISCEKLTFFVLRYYPFFHAAVEPLASVPIPSVDALLRCTDALVSLHKRKHTSVLPVSGHRARLEKYHRDLRVKNELSVKYVIFLTAKSR